MSILSLGAYNFYFLFPYTSWVFELALIEWGQGIRNIPWVTLGAVTLEPEFAYADTNKIHR